jgi:histidine ammonia-lyase
MSMTAALKAARAVELARAVVAVELLCAAQAIDLLAPLVTSSPLTHVHESIRARVSTLDLDRPPSRDITTIASMIEAGDLDRACPLNVN